MQYGQPVAQTISIHSQGTAFVFKKFDERVTQEYSDYRRVIQEPPAEISDKDSTASPHSIVDEEPGT